MRSTHVDSHNLFLEEEVDRGQRTNFGRGSLSLGRVPVATMHIYLRNTPANFHPDPVWNDGAFGFFEEWCRPNKKKRNKKKLRPVAIWDQLRVQKNNGWEEVNVGVEKEDVEVRRTGWG